MDDLVIYIEGQAMGVVPPSTLFSSTLGGLAVNGPRAVAETTEKTEQALLESLKAAGAFVEGTPSEVDEVLSLLSEPQTSRTVSYLLCYASNCRSLLGDLKRLSDSRILIVGCGGIGSSVAMLLAGAGIRKFRLIDADIVEKSNLNRQLFWVLEDIGRKKVDVLKNALEARFEAIDIECLTSSPQTAGIVELASSDIQGVVITADNPTSLAREGWKITQALDIPVVSGGYLHQTCASFHFVPGDCNEIEAVHERQAPEYWSALPSSIMPSYGPMNFSLASALASNLVASLAENVFGKQKTSLARWQSRSQMW